MSKLYKLLTFSAVMLLLTACTATPASPKAVTSDIQQTLNKQLALWEKAAIDNYSYVFQRSCFCTPEYTKAVLVRVREGNVVDARFKDSNKVLPKALERNRQTIKNLFDIIQNAINRKAASIKVKYDPKYAYPGSIAVDYDAQIADEELYISAKDFKPDQ